MLLQIPVEGGHRGGDFHVRFGREICSYRPEANSGDAFHVHVFYDDCRHRLERLTDGWRLVLVFRLVVRKSALRTPALLDRPLCVSTSEAVASLLEPWLQLDATGTDDVVAVALDHAYLPERYRP